MENEYSRKFITALVFVSILIAASALDAASSQAQRGPRIDLLRFNVTRSPAAQLIEMTNGPPSGSDIWQHLQSTSDIDEMARQGKTVTSTGGFHVCYFGFHYRKPPLNDVNFRHALAHLVPKDRIIGSLFRYTVVKINTKVPPAQSLWYNSEVDPHPYSPEEAQIILGHEHSLYQKTVSVWQYKTGAPLETVRVFSPLEVVAPATYSTARMFVEECNEIGLMNVQHVPLDWATLLDLVFNQWDYEVYWACITTGRAPTHLYYELHSNENYPGSSNAHGISYPELDDLLEILMFSLDHSAKVVAAYEAQELIAGGTTTDPLPTNVQVGDSRQHAIPVVPVYSRNHFDAMHPLLKGAVNMYGYGISNMWTYMNIYWDTPNEYRPGTTERTAVEILEDYPARLNPLTSTKIYAHPFIELVRDELITANPYTHKDEPWLATHWQYYPVPGGMDVVFDLRLTDSQGQPIMWQDGDPISVSDVKFAWDFLHDEETPSYWYAFRFYDSCTIIDSDTIVAHMSTTSQWLAYDLAATAFMLPPQVWADDGVGHTPWPTDATRLQAILGWDPSAVPYPDSDGAGPLTAVPTCLFGTGPFINQHSTLQIQSNGYADFVASRNYWLTTDEIEQIKSEMFHSAGDVNYDGSITTLDMALIALAFNTVPGDELWNPNADICGPAGSPPDSSCDIFDAATAGKFYGDTKTVPYP